MSARLKGRYRQVERLLADVVAWARDRGDVEAVALVGSYARGRAGMASDVDLTVLTPAFAELAADGEWFERLRPGSRLIRSAAWGPLLERRYRLRSGLQVEVGLVSSSWAQLPLDPGTRRVLGDGHRVLHDPRGLLARAGEALTAG
ncbi:nucleotidyltransferase-like protein [Kineococcus xinjiangensis]|uniref:Nucleotidyltransferase-like protein n=1 Tax=Kineococcus xinjiangensis TaxID=512762 RepID=A0A2S6IWF8_9ACTN|nr:nucleotidyltransferase domain-containing protein [Kineococcus xinjiangensis]PPK98692.1 nucleotidyltransferase-like protein [Kineococcus xinjiangensis]